MAFFTSLKSTDETWGLHNGCGIQLWIY